MYQTPKYTTWYQIPYEPGVCLLRSAPTLAKAEEDVMKWIQFIKNTNCFDDEYKNNLINSIYIRDENTKTKIPMTRRLVAFQTLCL